MRYETNGEVCPRIRKPQGPGQPKEANLFTKKGQRPTFTSAKTNPKWITKYKREGDRWSRPLSSTQSLTTQLMIYKKMDKFQCFTCQKKEKNYWRIKDIMCYKQLFTSPFFLNTRSFLSPRENGVLKKWWTSFDVHPCRKLDFKTNVK